MGLITGTTFPVPVKPKVCGLFGALSVMARFATRVPAAAGVKVKLMLPLPLGAIVIGSELARVNSDALVPVMERAVMTSGAVPEFEIGMLTVGEVVCTSWVPTL